MVVIIDYGLGNLFSVVQALKRVGLDSVVTDDPAVVASAEAVVLPGVGAFGVARETLRAKGLDRAIMAHITAGKPFLGICLGFQLLFRRSNEYGDHCGLGFFPGHVERMPESVGRIPEIGWNVLLNHADTEFGDRVATAGDWYYFVHSYCVLLDGEVPGAVFAEYNGFRYCAGVIDKNVWAVQFHPEKSGEHGLLFYRAFAGYIKKKAGL
jgi:glutamine amidotransferase